MAVRSFLFYANHVAASVHGLQYSRYQAQKSVHTHSKAKLSKLPRYLKVVIASEPMSDRKYKSRYGIFIK